MIAVEKKEKTKALSTNTKELENVISAAISKVRGNKENDLCKYLPSNSGGYIHHFTMRKMKGESPEQLLSMLTKFIIDVDKPKAVAPKRRAPRGSRKHFNEVSFSKGDFDRLLAIASSTGDRDLVKKFMPKKTLKTLKRELIASIRKEKVSQDLWGYYVDAVSDKGGANAPGEYPYLENSDIAKLFTTKK